MLGGAAGQLLGERLGELHEAGAGVGLGGQFEHVGLRDRGRRPGRMAPAAWSRAQSAMTPTSTGTPLVTMSKTAERACARSTTSRSFSGGASPCDLEAHADLAEAVAHLVGEAERAADVHVALERRLDGGQAHLARGRDVDQRGGQAGRQRVQQGLGRVRAGVAAEQDRRLAGVERERVRARRVLLAGAVEGLDRRAVVRAVDPAVLGAELEDAERGVGLDRVERAVHLLAVDAVADAVEDRGHADLLGRGLDDSGDAPVGGPDVDAGERGRGRGRDEEREHQVVRSVGFATVRWSRRSDESAGRAGHPQP